MQLPLKNKSSCRAWFLRFISYFISLINTALFYDPLRSFTLPLIDYLFQLLKLIIIIFNYFLDAVHRWKCQHHLTIKLTFHLTLTGFFFNSVQLLLKIQNCESARKKEFFEPAFRFDKWYLPQKTFASKTSNVCKVVF